MKGYSLTCAVALCAVLHPAFVAAVEPCPADLSGDGQVNAADLALLLGSWGPQSDQPADFNQDGLVNAADLAMLLGAWGVCSAATPTELAGNALEAYPFFEYVSAFNSDAPVHAAVDTTRFSDLADTTVDLYVVAARTVIEWELDAALLDVRVDGAQAVTLSSGPIEGNTFQVAEPWELGSDAGANLGVGYDIVLDVNRNGLLDGLDYIDGLAEEAGFYMVHDLTDPGPLPVTSIIYSGGAFLGQKVWYPTSIASMGQLPLVVISHGNGHQYTWYDYLQQHLASYGFIVMSHENNTQPGIESASTTTLTNTDYFLGHVDVIGGGVFDGHVDDHRLVWIGHSRGGEGVCRAADRLFDGDFTPQNYTLADLALISSIAPNDYLGRENSTPHHVNFHLLYGSADGDNGGWPDLESDASFHVYERAEGYRQVTYVHGADHNDFNCCGWNDFEGPSGTAIGRSAAQQVAKAAYLALIMHYVEGNYPARDYLWRPYDRLRPMGVDTDVIVDHEYVEGPGEGVAVIDDFQSEAALNTSSSGGTVTFDVQNPWEGQLDDTDGTFTWSAGDPMNGMVRGRENDLSRGMVFNWSIGNEYFLDFEIVPELRDFRDHQYLCFRACQGTRHPRTIAELVDVTFTVSLEDAAGAVSSIDIDAYGAGIQEPYQRTGSGSGAGWQNEFETVRIRLTDFLHNGSALDLSQIVAVRFDFGLLFGSRVGRLAIDDLYLSRNALSGGP